MTKEQGRQALYDLLGNLPSQQLPVHSTLISKEEREYFFIEKLSLGLNGIEPVPAYFISPKDAGEKTPVVLYNHSHGERYHVGKDEVLTSAPYLFATPYAEVLATCGYSILCIDEWAFGERSGRKESEIFKSMLWKGSVMWGMMVYDSIRAIDYLHTRHDIDTSRIATLGMSMGSTKAWWLSALDTRIKVCVDICCMTEFETLLESKNIDQHGIYYFVPGLINHFTTSQINALISPRPHLSLNGILDRLTPEIGLDRIQKELKKSYKEEGVPERFELKKYPVGHVETAEMRNEVLKFLNTWL